MISKELLSEVLGKTIGDFTLFNNNAITYQYWVECKNHIGIDISGYDMEYINIYELALHKCKEWAYSKGYTLASYQSGENWYVCRDPHKSNPYVGEVTEPEAIFKACELILKDKR